MEFEIYINKNGKYTIELTDQFGKFVEFGRMTEEELRQLKNRIEEVIGK